jgi:hypothetical protein
VSTLAALSQHSNNATGHNTGTTCAYNASWKCSSQCRQDDSKCCSLICGTVCYAEQCGHKLMTDRKAQNSFTNTAQNIGFPCKVPSFKSQPDVPCCTSGSTQRMPPTSTKALDRNMHATSAQHGSVQHVCDLLCNGLKIEVKQQHFRFRARALSLHLPSGNS